MIITDPVPVTLSTCLRDFYRCAEIPEFKSNAQLPSASGFFRFGKEVICYGQASGQTSSRLTADLYDASLQIQNGRSPLLPFDPAQVIDNLRYESYVPASNRFLSQSWIKNLYYYLRPLMPVGVRKHLQGLYLRDWEKLTFPAWPVDRSVDLLHEKLLVLAMGMAGIERLPFVWFWPHGHSSCAIMTHDVETTEGRDFCDRTMDIDDLFGFKASFQIVPEKRYSVTEQYLDSIRTRGFEVNVQGLDHDGDLFQNRGEFLEKAAAINKYARAYDARGFRSPILYRNSHWFQELDFSYDLSVPNVARLEAQRGGCCTIFPYFLPGGAVRMTEIPLTITEDYSLFHVLNDYSTTLWEKQMDIILQGHGLMTFLIHPDYVVTGRAQDTFKKLLEKAERLRADKNVWTPLPRDVDRWWRERNDMNLITDGSTWRIVGKGSERARIAYACVDGDRLTYEIDSSR